MEHKAILVIGGGMSGMTAAVEAAEAGANVFLVEKDFWLGGRVASSNRYFPKLCPPYCGLEINFRRIRQNPKITVYTGAEVQALNGTPGNFEAVLKIQPRYINEKCTACGECVEACPRNLFELHPVSEEIIVFCRSRDRGAVSRKYCKNACIACGICVRACPEAIILENNLAKITDYKKIQPEKIPEIEKCPTNSIGRIHTEKEDEG